MELVELLKHDNISGVKLLQIGSWWLFYENGEWRVSGRKRHSPWLSITGYGDLSGAIAALKQAAGVGDDAT